MAEHRVTIRQPDREVVNADVVFEVYADDEKLGELEVSRGGITWWPARARTRRIDLTWEQFSRLLQSTDY
ncbi:MAG: hypothetical protein JWL83_2714 [Actinomycetia bacterium]|jgi:hypothetical protein|nr:hypothetical protein [Actinomycetes bacterium]